MEEVVDLDPLCFRCLTYDHLPAGCHMEKPPNECCAQPVCNGQPITSKWQGYTPWKDESKREKRSRALLRFWVSEWTIVLNEIGHGGSLDQKGVWVVDRPVRWVTRSTARLSCPLSTPFPTLNCGSSSRWILINHSPPPFFPPFPATKEIFESVCCCFRRYDWNWKNEAVYISADNTFNWRVFFGVRDCSAMLSTGT